MYTRCPKCSTCFRVTDRHLAIAKGKVRCGQCKLVFNAPEHAIDDLPINQLTAQASTKPAPPITDTEKNKVKKVAPLAPTAKEKIEAIAKPAEVKKAKTPKDKAPIAKEAVTKNTVFDADETMIADIDALDKDDLHSIDLDAPSDTQDKTDDDNEYEDLFDDDFDLNTAIDELNEAAEHEGEIEVEATIPEEKTTTRSEPDTPEQNDNDDVFTTDVYDATSASSVADILNEMEGQLSLDIAEPDKDDEYDANDEFEFIALDDETEHSDQQSNETNDETLEKHFDIKEFGFDDISEDDVPEKEIIENNKIDEDELFDQIDLSDFNDSDFNESEVQEEVVLEEPHSINIGQHSPDDENDIPFQLRNDIERLQAPSQRHLHPLLKLSFIIILLVLSFAQLAYFRAHELVNLAPSTRPLLELFCENIGCMYSGPHDKKQIQLLSRDVRLHPKEKKALLISAAIINNASFAQPYPDIHIRLSDISGNIVAERIFNAKTYMGKLSNPFLLMKSKIPVHINFEVVDPGKDAVNFEFTFL